MRAWHLRLNPKPFGKLRARKIVNLFPEGYFIKDPGKKPNRDRLEKKITSATNSKVVRMTNGQKSDEITEQDILDHEAKYGSNVTRIIRANPKNHISNQNQNQNTYNINMPFGKNNFFLLGPISPTG